MQLLALLVTENTWLECGPISQHKMAMSFVQTGYIWRRTMTSTENYAHDGNYMCEARTYE